MNWKSWAMDVTMEPPCFCPVEGDPEGEFSIVDGMNLITDTPPGRVVMIIHANGQAAVDAWLWQNGDRVERIQQHNAALAICR